MPFPYKLPSGRTITFADEPMRDFTPDDIQHFEEITMVMLSESEKEAERHRMASECRCRNRGSHPLRDEGVEDLQISCTESQ